jgi:hypothetical protein
VECATQTIPNLNGAATGGVEQPVRTQALATAPRARVQEKVAAAGDSVAGELAKRLNPWEGIRP